MTIIGAVVSYRRVILPILLISLFGPSTAAAQAKLDTIHTGYPTIALDIAPWWIGKAAGLFRKEGIEIDATYIKGDSSLVQALLAGNVDVGYGGAAPVVAAIARGAAISIIAIPINRLDYVLITKEPIKTAHDLVGKKFAISTFGSSSEVATRLALDRVGADLTKVALIQVGGSPDRLAALRSGSVDGTIISGIELARGINFHTVFDFTKSDIEYPFTAIYVSKQLVQERRNVVLQVLKGYIRSVGFFRANREESIKVSSKMLKNTDMESFRRQWKYVADLFQQAPYPTEAGFRLALKGMLSTNPKAAALPMSQIVDTSFLNELSKTGFIQ